MNIFKRINHYSKESQTIKIFCYVFWFKYEYNLKIQLKEKYSTNIDEPLLYNIIEGTKSIIDNSLKDKEMLLNLLSEIRELIVMKVHMTIDNFLLNETGSNDDLEEDFEYMEIKFRYPQNNKEIISKKI